MTEKSKMVHEEVYEKFGVEPEKLNTENDPIKPFPHKWIKELINHCLGKLNTQNVLDKEINETYSRIVFSSKEEADSFKNAFNKVFLVNLNDFIKNIKNDNPRIYNRNLVITMNEDSPIVEMNY